LHQLKYKDNHIGLRRGSHTPTTNSTVQHEKINIQFYFQSFILHG